MAISVRFAGFGEGAHFNPNLFDSKVLPLILDRYNAAIEAGGDYQVLVCNLLESHFENKTVYVAGKKMVSNHHDAKTLVFSGENDGEIHTLPLPAGILSGIIVRLFRRLGVCCSRLPAVGERLATASMLLQYKIGWLGLKMKYGFKPWTTIRWSLARHPHFYYRPNFTRHIRQLPDPNHHAILTSQIQSNRQENIFNLPHCFHPLLGEWARFTEIKRNRLYEKKTRFCAFIASGPTHSLLTHLRILFCLELAKYKPVDCYGAALNNTLTPRELLERHSEKQASLAHFTEADIRQANNRAWHPDCGVVYRPSLNQELFRDRGGGLHHREAAECYAGKQYRCLSRRPQCGGVF